MAGTGNTVDASTVAGNPTSKNPMAATTITTTTVTTTTVSGDIPLPPGRTLTIGGLPGTGTSTLCKVLSAQLRLPYMYAGGIFREEATRRGLSLADFGALCQKDPTIDQALDDRQLGMLRKGGLILEGRLAGWLAHRHKIPALRVWVTCEDKERIRRIVQRDGGDETTQRQATEAREASEADRYRRYYGADPTDPSRYDLILDSTRQAPDQLAAQIIARLTQLAARQG